MTYIYSIYIYSIYIYSIYIYSIYIYILIYTYNIYIYMKYMSGWFLFPKRAMDIIPLGVFFLPPGDLLKDVHALEMDDSLEELRH